MGDLVGSMWLQQYLREEILDDTILVIISHDRELLDEVCTDIVEIRQKGIHQVSGNFSEWKRAKEEKEASIRAKLDAVEIQEKRASEQVQKMKQEANKKGKDADPNKQRQAKEKEIKLLGKTSSSGEKTTYGKLGLYDAKGGKYKHTIGKIQDVRDIHEVAAAELGGDGPKIKIRFPEPEQLE